MSTVLFTLLSIGYLTGLTIAGRYLWHRAGTKGYAPAHRQAIVVTAAALGCYPFLFLLPSIPLPVRIPTLLGLGLVILDVVVCMVGMLATIWFTQVQSTPLFFERQRRPRQ